MAVIKEFRLFLLAVVLPAVFIAAGGAWLVKNAYARLWKEELEILDVQAGLVADALVRSAHEYGFGEDDHDFESGLHHHHDFDEGGPHHHDFEDGGPPRHGGPAGGKQFSSRRPPRPPHLHEHRWLEDDVKRLSEICRAYIETVHDESARVAFAIFDLRGNRVYATDDYPKRTSVSGSCHLGPPLGDGMLVTTRADGGAATRRSAAILVIVGACIVMLLIASGVGAGLMMLREMKRRKVESRRQTDFIDNVSHELKTPLAGIRLNAELLHEGRIRDATKRQGALEAILIESDRLEHMVAELLDYSRLDKGTKRYDIQELDLSEFVSQPSETEAIAAISNSRATVSAKHDGVKVLADVNILRQIGINLVTNAVKYTEGPIEIVAEGNELKYMDRGPGIPRGDEERIFERFYRCDNSLERRVNGSGLGLSIARTLARGMGGDLKYTRRPGGGSIFTIIFALAGENGKGANGK